MHAHASFLEAVKAAAASLRSSVLRSILTLLGIILATTTLISVMSVIEGMDRFVAESISSMGADGFRVRRIVMTQYDPKKFLEMQRRNPELTREEFQYVKSHARMIRDIGIVTRRNVPVHCGKLLADGVSLQGATPNIALISNTQPETGRFFSETDDRRRLAVAFIGNDLKERFFPNVNEIGKTILIAGRPFEVIGTAKAKGSIFGNSQDNFVMIPAETYFKMYGARYGMGFDAVALDRDHLIQAQDEARMLLRAFRHLAPGQEDTFSMVSSDALVDAWDQMTGAIAAAAIGVVSVFMVVGGVVIMNIMLAVVTERTHEIGIRKSVGARRVDILNQFLVESSMLAASGGVVGVVLAWIVALVVGNFTPVPISMPVSAVVLSVAISACVGLFFGIYPAQRAARLDPIEALRAEK